PGGRIHSLEHRRRRRHARLFAAAAATLVAVGGGTLLGTELLDGDDARNSHTAPPADPPRRPGPGEAAAYPVTASGTHYRAATLGDQVADVVTRGRTLTAHRPPGARLAGCVEEHTRGVKPVLVDAATFESREATVIVIPADASTWRVVVAGPGCGPGVPDVLRRTDIPARTP
ncbi:MAG TPA: hypothetical protein VHJ17_22585, partial [Thermomonospora sp.]|nr:hypothetical protein [Thermomonospora sp.]